LQTSGKPPSTDLQTIRKSQAANELPAPVLTANSTQHPIAPPRRQKASDLQTSPLRFDAFLRLHSVFNFKIRNDIVEIFSRYSANVQETFNSASSASAVSSKSVFHLTTDEHKVFHLLVDGSLRKKRLQLEAYHAECICEESLRRFLQEEQLEDGNKEQLVEIIQVSSKS